jgi:hypothetical protein
MGGRQIEDSTGRMWSGEAKENLRLRSERDEKNLIDAKQPTQLPTHGRIFST